MFITIYSILVSVSGHFLEEEGRNIDRYHNGRNRDNLYSHKTIADDHDYLPMPLALIADSSHLFMSTSYAPITLR